MSSADNLTYACAERFAGGCALLSLWDNLQDAETAVILAKQLNPNKYYCVTTKTKRYDASNELHWDCPRLELFPELYAEACERARARQQVC